MSQRSKDALNYAISNRPRGNAGDLDFIIAASLTTPGVVHIKSTYNNTSPQQKLLERIYGPGFGGNLPSMSSGSGVILTEDGYITTNNHVVENATKIEVILADRREYVAELVGRDPNTDLALLKIKGKDFPLVKLGNSDSVMVGEWVLAVGFPYSLNTTVTAGIVSAKGRSIGIINTSAEGAPQQGNTAIESFIQTDAAINPGNSGGALVNTNGELIGINAAIASLTGSYAGYAFAIPVNLAKKILDDLKKYGAVKRGVLGISFPSPAVENDFLKQQGITPGSVNGVFITQIQSNSAAALAGLKEGDIIQRIDGQQLNSSSEFSERIARHGPGDKVNITYLRKGKSNQTVATLKAEPNAAEQSTMSLKEIYQKLGARFSPLTPKLKEHFQLNNGVLVTEVAPTGLFAQLGIPPGTIIALINGREVSSAEDIEKAFLDARNGQVKILAIAPDGSRVAFNFSFGT
ncbi:trypsin-like peptidase domain-containing protein [Pedobacter sp.]|uniref:trypsin-like peptidase domain-containing protein n=1 Tax=Pedobacter sp. TaxID=1411316 RepID=UPI003D7F6AB1